MINFRTTFLLLALVSVFFMFTYILSSEKARYYLSPEISENVLLDQLNASFPIKFYHNAYLDLRTSPPRLRLFSLNGCIKPNNFLAVDLFYEGFSNPIRLNVSGNSLDGNCPSKYGPEKPCFYLPHTFTENVTMAGGMKKVEIHMGHRKVILPVKEINKPYETGITVCLQPVYYYSQWQNAVLYIEAWRAQGATRFILFYHSATKEARKVLEYYLKLGIIELRSWPSFPSLPAEIADKYPKMDDSSFIFSYFLAMNICILDIKTQFGTVADFDEVLVPTKGTLIEYATKQMKGTNVGALSFANNYVAIEPNIYTSNYSGVASPIFFDKGGPRKYIFDASVINICAVHWVGSFIDKTKKTKNGDGALMHLRYNVRDYKAKTVVKPYRFFPGNVSYHIENMHKTTREIFGNNPPTVSFELIYVLNKCVERITKKGNTCRSTGGMCKADMDEIYDWVYDKTEGIFL
ncbi:hypothetical protein CAEBREN_06089 [Caenorhabditis brenneri]|uniref:Glycosyltransferase family 92 protein n=1 Tax=Caenorhabditis brenneri TaxID=135651 RepID=G0MTT9_CAEBE|nr:hypothetical protein CAEBREN_06089 [Caenorhabditis brenneri]